MNYFNLLRRLTFFSGVLSPDDKILLPSPQKYSKSLGLTTSPRLFGVQTILFGLGLLGT